VNDVFRTSFTFELSDVLVNSTQKLIYFLKDEGIIKKHIHNSKITIDGDPECLYFNYMGDPQFELRKEEEVV
jgi:hypothetical protein